MRRLAWSGRGGPVSHGAMPMPGMQPAGGSMTGLWQQPVWAVAVTLGFVALFAVATVWFLVDLARTPAGPRGAAPLSPLAQTLLNLVMAIGMGASFLVMS